MKILLISPPFKSFSGLMSYYYPVGLGYIAGVLKSEGNSVVILDADLLEKTQGIDFFNEREMMDKYLKCVNDTNHHIWNKIEKLIESYNPDIVGINAMTMYFASALNVAKIVKKYNKKCSVIMGGPHPTLEPGQTLESENVDYVCIGESEEAIKHLVKKISQNDSSFESIEGVGFKRNGKTIINNKWQIITQLDSIPWSGREMLYDKNKYTPEDMSVIMSSRGCPFKCAFCSHITKTRFRSVDNVIAEIQDVIEKYHTKQIAFKDDSFTVNRKRVVEICEAILSNKMSINWECTTRVDLIDDELLRIMKRAGCNNIKIGVETGSQEIMDKIQKGITFKQVKEASRLLNKNGIFWTAYFIIGLPIEKEKDIQLTYEFMKEIKPSYSAIGLYKQLPKTVMYDISYDLGLLKKEINIEHFYNVNPIDYYYDSPQRRMYYIDNERFESIYNKINQAFNRHNVSWMRLTERAWSRRKLYADNRLLILSDFKKALQILKVK